MHKAVKQSRGFGYTNGTEGAATAITNVLRTTTTTPDTRCYYDSIIMITTISITTISTTKDFHHSLSTGLG
jgi:hypothetical protein